MNLDEGIVRIGLAGEKRLDLGALGFAFEAAQGALTFGNSVGIAFGIAEFDQGDGVLEFLFEALDRLDLGSPARWGGGGGGGGGGVRA